MKYALHSNLTYSKSVLISFFLKFAAETAGVNELLHLEAFLKKQEYSEKEDKKIFDILKRLS